MARARLEQLKASLQSDTDDAEALLADPSVAEPLAAAEQILQGATLLVTDGGAAMLSKAHQAQVTG